MLYCADLFDVCGDGCCCVAESCKEDEEAQLSVQADALICKHLGSGVQGIGSRVQSKSTISMMYYTK